MKKRNTARALVAHHVRRLRLEAGLSQELLAAKCGFHRTYISQVEREQSNMTLDNLQRIAEVLEVGPAKLLEAI
jgi:transcriptional regulator with XRE-family HTH domain